MKKLHTNSSFIVGWIPNTHKHSNIEVWKHTRIFFYNVFLLLILMLTFNSGINGQTAGSPCGCVGYTVRGTSGGISVISSMTTPVANCTWFRGTVQIIGTVNWTNLSIRMAGGSRIEVDGQFNVDRCNIGTCDTLWRGIKVLSPDGNGITFTNSNISGANIAIELEDETSYFIQGNTFENNYIGISTGSPFEAVPSDITVFPGDGIILGCRFFTSTQLPPPYSGHFYYPSWPLIASIPYNQGYAALYIAGSTGLNLGQLNPNNANRNMIDSMRNGVIVRSATTRILGTDFENFVGSVSKIALLGGHLDVNQTGILLYGNATCHIEQDTFRNVMKGVRSTRSSQIIVDNFMNIPILSPIEATRGIDIDQPVSTYIAENTIFNGYLGISVSGSSAGIVIRDNDLYRSLTAGNNAGINLYRIYGVSLNNRVHDNELEITGGQRAVGISMNNVQELSLIHNTIDFLQTEPLPAGYENAGISGLDVRNSRIRSNYITGSSHYSLREDNVGIIMTNGMANDLFCNETTNMYFGQRYFGPNMVTVLRENKFYDAFRGLELFSPVSLGKQEHFGNRWWGTYTEFGAFINATNPSDPDDILDMELTAITSQFIADESDDDPGVLIPYYGPQVAIDNEWFKDNEGEVGPTICIAYPDDDLPLTDTLVDIVRHPFTFTRYGDEMNWMRKADILTLLHLYPAYLSNTVLDSFFSAEATTPLGELIWAQYYMGKTHGIDPDLAETDSLVFDYSAQVRILDSLIALNPYNVVALKALRVLKIDTLAEHMNDWLGMLDAQISDTEDSIDFALNVVDNVTPSNVQETDLQAMLWLKAGHGKGDSLTTAELEGVYALARQCPWIGARSLSEAQILYSIIADSIFTHRPGECAELDPFIIIEDRSDNSGFVSEIRIHPNPASDIIYLQLPDWVETVEIHSLDGRMWKQLLTPDGGNYSMSISDIPSGIYTIRTQGAKRMETQQISITR